VIDDSQRSFLRAFGLAVLAGLGAFPTAGLMIAATILGHRIDVSLGMPYPIFLGILLAVAVPISILTMVLLARLAIRVALGKSQPVSHQPSTAKKEDET
jgi:hypothetical protein